MNLILLLSLILVATLIAYLIFWKLFFLRDPERIIPKGKNIVSPADGVIIDIKKIKGKTYAKKKFLGGITIFPKEEVNLISIFMSPLDVHINRVPIDGKIISINHISGKFLPVNTLKRAIENEKCEMILETPIGKVSVIQVAGLIARRIENHKSVGDEVNKGERFGLINLGSQLIVLIPKKLKYSVKVGDRVKAGESVIAKY